VNISFHPKQSLSSLESEQSEGPHLAVCLIRCPAKLQVSGGKEQRFGWYVLVLFLVLLEEITHGNEQD